MSEAILGLGATKGTALQDLERRLTIAALASPPSLQDQLDWAEQLTAEDAPEEGRLLSQSAAIQSGVSSQPTAGPGNTVALAMSELRNLARVVGPSIAARVREGPTRATFSPGLHPVARLANAAPQPSRRPLRALVAELGAWLQAPAPDAADTERAGGLIDMLRGACALEPQALSRFAAAPPGLLAEVVALTSLRRFLQGVSDLLHEPLGSTGLFHATARLDRDGLGAYFSNIGQIARRSADLFELADIAAPAASPDADAGLRQAWVALMSRGLGGGALEEVVDDLGDRQASFALETILRRCLQAPPDEINLALVKRLRDAALDNLDYPLAAHAQRAVVELRSADPLERIILGGIDASGGRYKAAEDTFVACLTEAPEDEDLRARLDAVRMRRFEPYAIGQGFSSPRDRQLYRLRHRSERRPGMAAA